MGAGWLCNMGTMTPLTISMVNIRGCTCSTPSISQRIPKMERMHFCERNINALLSYGTCSVQKCAQLRKQGRLSEGRVSSGSRVSSHTAPHDQPDHADYSYRSKREVRLTRVSLTIVPMRDRKKQHSFLPRIAFLERG